MPSWRDSSCSNARSFRSPAPWNASPGSRPSYAPSAYIGLWSRLRDFRRDALTEALERRRVVQGTLMRATIHVISPCDFHLFAAAIRKGRRDWWLRAQRKQLAGIDMDAVAARVRKHLAGGSLWASELQERLRADGYPRIAAVTGGMWVDLVRVPPSSTREQRRADLYGLADHWSGPSDATAAEGLVHLVRRYLDGFGPASLDDLASWAGLPAATLRPVVDRLRLRRFRDEHGRELLACPVRLWPTRTPRRRFGSSRSGMPRCWRMPGAPGSFLPYRPLVFNTKTPLSVATFLVDGAVAGAWHYERERGAARTLPPPPACNTARVGGGSGASGRVPRR